MSGRDPSEERMRTSPNGLDSTWKFEFLEIFKSAIVCCRYFGGSRGSGDAALGDQWGTNRKNNCEGCVHSKNTIRKTLFKHKTKCCIVQHALGETPIQSRVLARDSQSRSLGLGHWRTF